MAGRRTGVCRRKYSGNLVEENHSSATASSNRIQYTYDSYNRNTEVKGNNFLQKNIYDAEGYRCRLEENEKVTDFVYRGGRLLSEKTEENEPKKNYALGNEYIGLVSETGKESTARYYVTDEQGSVRYVLNGDGEVESCYQYGAFGETIIQEGNQSRLQYNSQIWDELSGLYYLRARYYNPRTGRFTQEDVIYDDGLNLYTYCNSNPVIYSDSSGFKKGKNANCYTKEGNGYGQESTADFEKRISKLSPEERVAAVKEKASQVAKDKGLIKDSKLSRMNGRDIYRDPKTGEYYSVDTQHGRFEHLNKKGKHLGEVDFNFGDTKPADKSGGHNIKVK